MIAIISDVHGNYEALKVVLKKIEQLEIKKNILSWGCCRLLFTGE